MEIINRQPASHPTGVKWEVEEPSEYRPKVLDDIGKEKAQFRVFYDVSVYLMHARSWQAATDLFTKQ